MSLKILTFFCFFFIIVSCKDPNQSSSEDVLVENEEFSKRISKSDIAKLKYADFELDSDAEKLTLQWDEYIKFRQLIENVKNANFSELKADHKALKTLIIDFKKNIPSALNSPSILARVMVFETKLFKLESLVNLSNINKEEFSSSVKDILIAFSNLNFQINKKLERDAQNIEIPL